MAATPETGVDGAGDVAGLLRSLTLEQKVALLDGTDFWRTEAISDADVPSIMLTDGPHGLRKQRTGGDHLGLADSVPATCFPTAAGLAATWNEELLHEVGAALGAECRAEDVAVLLGPGVNMKRSPLCGRNFEYFAEDPLLAGRLAAALVRGVQSRGVGTSVKHFAVNNQETDRLTVSAEVDERTLREIYLPAFEHVVREARPWTVMCSYNRINGVHAAENRWLLTELLREEWGFDGLVVSDWGAVGDRAASLRAGLDLEMPSSGGAGSAVVLAALRAGELDERDVDAAAERVLRLVRRATTELPAADGFDAAEHRALAERAAVESAVLLKNDDDVLPLDPPRTRVAVLGEFARTPRYQGAGSSQVVPTQLDDALGALRGAGFAALEFAPGYEVAAEAADPELIAEAVERAAAAEVAVLFLGLPPSAESEGYDREHLSLPEPQLRLLREVAAVNERVVVVLAGGSVVTVAEWERHAQAVLHGWLPGQAGGHALAALLTGAANPSGRLAETIPVRLAHNPATGAFPGEHGSVRYGEGLLIGYRWYDAHELPVSHEFGAGLSYTTFEQSDLAVEVVEDGPDPRVVVSLTVTNTGARAGQEVVQLYVADSRCSVSRPEQELKAFAKVALEPGAETRVVLELDRRAFAFWHTPLGRWVVEGGEFELRAAASSRDVRLTSTIRLAGEPVTDPLTPRSELGAWLDHPVAGELLREALAASPMAELAADPQHAMMLRPFPADRITRFPGVPLTVEQLERWAETANTAQR
ncbi:MULTISPECIES: glycoside hydrolase family 3 C-terminal domain-containing protein [unclassified Saccharopolyspora]|uniref:glycoside hydrolase family 3 C-terminal domain-containing protein n=1 Tax=unclassified Saccharopolyspora TaxID=2646250 RepID=UPI001CD60745|nr:MULTISPECIES: glycoside hydrolase family 3 C-terminal domain-containing protein [unclassified Saccharopolyspora]MCA1188829.1 glycoside hydrolase family 3 C-terminal domain-containing protein [Saccharopolyspora sp. 6T]MCA1281869.1 glycoside hydrolase family 3 C-terminal domain-containing protein [Saccharopolyspora sp. 7B]